jgi:hypothetical protein
LEDVWTLVKVDHAKEQLVRIQLGVAVGIGHNVKFVARGKFRSKYETNELRAFK